MFKDDQKYIIAHPETGIYEDNFKILLSPTIKLQKHILL